mgnify:CR=1 FL=1
MTTQTLIIAEKPSVAQTIAAALGVKNKKDGYIEGNGYIVSWWVRYFVKKEEPSAYGETVQQ